MTTVLTLGTYFFSLERNYGAKNPSVDPLPLLWAVFTFKSIFSADARYANQTTGLGLWLIYFRKIDYVAGYLSSLYGKVAHNLLWFSNIFESRNSINLKLLRYLLTISVIRAKSRTIFVAACQNRLRKIFSSFQSLNWNSFWLGATFNKLF